MADRASIAALACALLLAALATPCHATLPHAVRCYDGVCYDTLYGLDVRDTTYRLDASGRRYFLLRYTDGTELSFLLRPVSPAACGKPAKDDYAAVLAISAARIDLRGCLANRAAERYFLVDLALTGAPIAARTQLRRLGPSAYLRGITHADSWSGPTFDSDHLLLVVAPGSAAARSPSH